MGVQSSLMDGKPGLLNIFCDGEETFKSWVYLFGLQLDVVIKEMLSLQHHKTAVGPDTSTTKDTQSVEKGDVEQRCVALSVTNFDNFLNTHDISHTKT